MNVPKGFAVWITGLPASGKSTITRELVVLLAASGVRPVVLESDVLRTVLTPHPTYQEEERDRFYLQLAEIAKMLVDQGLPVVLDATANRRTYRDHARSRIPRFIEAFVRCSPQLCRERDPKGIYAAAASGAFMNVPGVQTAYEEPVQADAVLDCRIGPAVNAQAIVDLLTERRYI